MLISCEGCRRHVRADDEACPFCGAAVAAAPVARSVLEGRLSRAAVFASAVLVAPGCLVQSNPPPPNYQQHQQQPPPPPPSDDRQGFAEPPPDYSPPAPTGVVSGRVMDTNGTPLANVRVELHAGSQPLVGITDRDGNYLIVDVREGQYTLVVPGVPRRPVQAVAGREQIVNVTVPGPSVVPYDRHINAKPYGAPPARKRHV